ncbi:hypothetical protein [Bandra megavirus]|uniref:F-box domain-containing protein n=1 Tax=Bandra megavirus TaxID=2071566 RepID=A0A2K9V8Y3_9VIRU|nr:hypothetical protein [Bandra megavirus]
MTCEIIRIDCDVLLQIIYYLDINDIINLKSTCKYLNDICTSNYIWGKIFFDVQQGLSEKIMQMIYEKNNTYFLNYYYFKHYFGINYCLNGNIDQYNYLEMIKKIFALVPYFRAPYYHKELIGNILPIDNNIDEIMYVVSSVDEFPKYNNNIIWQHHYHHIECQILLILVNKSGTIKLKKFVKPHILSHKLFKKMKITMFLETVKKLFFV